MPRCLNFRIKGVPSTNCVTHFHDKIMQCTTIQCRASAWAATMGLLLLLALTASTSALDCGDGKIRGVNAGGWLLLEPWITPKLFEEVSSIPLEYRKLYKDIQCIV